MGQQLKWADEIGQQRKCNCRVCEEHIDIHSFERRLISPSTK